MALAPLWMPKWHVSLTPGNSPTAGDCLTANADWNSPPQPTSPSPLRTAPRARPIGQARGALGRARGAAVERVFPPAASLAWDTSCSASPRKKFWVGRITSPVGARTPQRRRGETSCTRDDGVTDAAQPADACHRPEHSAPSRGRDVPASRPSCSRCCCCLVSHRRTWGTTSESLR